MSPIKDLFFRRMKSLKGEIPDYYSYNLDQKIRHKMIGTILDHADNSELNDLVRLLEREFGKNISNARYDESQKIQDFLFSCSVDEFLTTIELLTALKHKNLGVFYQDSGRLYVLLSSLIEKINSIFKIDKVGYEIVPAGLDGLPFIVVPYNSQYLHLETIKQPMSLMHDEDFKGPLNEFESALDEYRNGEYKDAIHKANNAYESLLKAILDKKGIIYTKTDKIPDLVTKIKDNSNIIKPELLSSLESVWAVLKNGPNTIRNQPGVGHGQGADIKKIEKTYADLALRLVGTYIVFIIERYKETK